MVYYRKYRPQTIEELDSTAVRQKLTAVLKNPDDIPHAFLFTGPKGLGKTSTARIIAKIVNCIEKKDKRGTSGIEPCNECEQCRSITNGTNMDVMEIDAASNRGIDEIRELKEKIKLAPITSKKKVYIIDEVHMLTTEAFNALLKTLEEPPQHALFLLCTTEPQKVPATILSRTFHITFQKATKEELVRSFERIVKAEKIAITPGALQKIAALSEGGFRDGTKILEEVTAIAGGKKITPELIEEKYAIAGVVNYIGSFIEYLSLRQTKEALDLIGKLTGEGNDVKYFLEQVLMSLHEQLLGIVGVGERKVEKQPLSLAELRELLLLLSQALSEMRYSVLLQLPLELAVIEWGGSDSQNDIATLDKGDSTERSDDILVTEEKLTVTTLRKQAGNMKKIQAMYGEKEEKKKPVPGPTADVSVLNFSATGDITPEWRDAFWRAIIAEIKEHNHTLAGVLRGCMIKSFDRKHLVIETAYSFHREKLDNGKTKEIIETICRELTGNPVTVAVELKSS